MPGHTRAITHAYPELACDGDDTAFYTGTRVLKTKLCLQKMSQIIDFSQRMLAEVMALFPSRYLHIGGDEVNLTHPSEAGLLAKFYSALFDLAHQHNKQIIGWEELMAANATPERAIYQLWNLPSDYLTQAQQHQYPVVLSFCDFFYFDHGYYSDQPYMASWCDRGGVSMQKMQQFSMQPFASLNVIGVEAALWGELVRTEQRADRRLWPRLVAVAQIAWQPQLVTNMPSVQQTIGHLMHWLKIDFYQKEDFFHTIRK